MRHPLLQIAGLALLLAGPLWRTGAAADTLSPLTITCPADILVVNDTYQCSAIVTFAPVVAGAIPPYFVVCSPASGSPFPLGAATTVNCTVSDGDSRTASCSFTVTVRNSVPPPCTLCILNPNTNVCTTDFFMVASSPAGATFPSGVGPVNTPSPPVSCRFDLMGALTRSDGVKFFFDPYPVGTTVLTSTITGPDGSSSQCSVTITVLPPFVRRASQVYLQYKVPTPGGPVELSGTVALLFEVNFPLIPTTPIRIHTLIDLHDVVATLGGVVYHATNNVNAQLTSNQLSPIALSVPGRYKFEAQGKAALHSFSLDMPLDAVITGGALSSFSFRQPQLVQP